MSTTPYLITDSSAESSEDIQHPLHVTNFDTENNIELKGSINSSSKNSNKHDHYEHAAKSVMKPLKFAKYTRVNGLKEHRFQL
ncbi:36317_t:CDS:2 [Racocetra persica]|uniref:36317_t:CDS:1 n=1 Tax=Racocetra persica TaxID=160502 RepID=A0ACA9K890_9GLOM|nr:36317_t:CDS:2 [Racocetra persica]